jgi:hypothetical protein
MCCGLCVGDAALVDGMGGGGDGSMSARLSARSRAGMDSW